MQLVILLVAVGGALVALWGLEKRRRKTYAVTGGLHPEVSLPHQAEFELYSNAFSHCSRKTRVVFAELGIPVRHHPIDLIETGWYQTISPAYLRINPAGLVPTLVHKGHPVYESDDIMAYAVACAPAGAPQLTPSAPAQSAEMERWIARATLPSEFTGEDAKRSAGACVPGLTLPIFTTAIRYISPIRILPGLLFHRQKSRPVFFLLARLQGLRLCQTPRIRGMIRFSRDQMKRHLQELEAQLAANGPWLMGEQYTLADVSWSAVLLRLDETGWLAWFDSVAPLPATLAYYDRLRGRPSWQTAISDMTHPVIERASRDLKQAIATDARLREALYA